MKKTFLGLVIVASIFLAGCPAFTFHRLYNDSDNVTEPALVGKWISEDADDKGWMSFEKAAGTGYSMTTGDPDYGFTDVYDVHLVRLNGVLFADMQFSRRMDSDKNVDLPFGTIATHMIARLVVEKDNLSLSTMEDDSFKNKTQTDKRIAGDLEFDSENSLVMADTESLRKYVAAHSTDAFSEPGRLRRAK